MFQLGLGNFSNVIPIYLKGITRESIDKYLTVNVQVTETFLDDCKHQILKGIFFNIVTFLFQICFHYDPLPHPLQSTGTWLRTTALQFTNQPQEFLTLSTGKGVEVFPRATFSQRKAEHITTYRICKQT